jgi:hypothetical protein
VWFKYGLGEGEEANKLCRDPNRKGFEVPDVDKV